MLTRMNETMQKGFDCRREGEEAEGVRAKVRVELCARERTRQCKGVLTAEVKEKKQRERERKRSRTTQKKPERREQKVIKECASEKGHSREQRENGAH